MTIGSALKIALGLVCFGIGAAGVIVTICMVPFISASDAAVPAMFGVFGAMFLWITFLLFDGCAGTMTNFKLMDAPPKP